MRVIDRKLLKEFSRKPNCEVCGAKNIHGLDPHHLLSRGAGRVDVRCNILAACRPCHVMAHAGSDRDRLVAIVAEREQMTADAIWAEVWRIRRDQSKKVEVVS